MRFYSIRDSNHANKETLPARKLNKGPVSKSADAVNPQSDSAESHDSPSVCCLVSSKSSSRLYYAIDHLPLRV